MIVSVTNGDIFETEHKHIAFAVNSEGVNDTGFAGFVARHYWPEIAYRAAWFPPRRHGLVLSMRLGNGRTLHALVCHSLSCDGWADTPCHVEQCLKSLPVPAGETIAMVRIGAGPVGRMMGADWEAIERAVEASERPVAIYYL